MREQDKQVAERRLRKTAVVSEARAKRTKQSMIAQAEIYQIKVKMIALFIIIMQFPECIARMKEFVGDQA